jgi:hypothetical protein
MGGGGGLFLLRVYALFESFDVFIKNRMARRGIYQAEMRKTAI